MNKFPNLNDKYETIKNLNPLEIKLIKMKIKILNPIKPLEIVKTLYGKGVKPAKKRILTKRKTHHYLINLLKLVSLSS